MIKIIKSTYDSPLIRVFTTIQDQLLSGINCCIAGGSVLKQYCSLPIGSSDIDIWFKSEADFLEAIDRFVIYDRLATTKNGMTYLLTPKTSCFSSNIKIQLLKTQYYDDVFTFLDSFDLTICQLGFIDGDIYITEQAEHDIKHRILRKGNDKVLKPFRFLKYLNLGYTPTIETYDDFFINDKKTLEIGDYEITAAGDLYD